MKMVATDGIEPPPAFSGLYPHSLGLLNTQREPTSKTEVTPSTEIDSGLQQSRSE